MAGAVGNDAGAVNRAIARLDPAIAERVIRTGPVDDATKRWLLQHARALAYPSLDEGFGFPILEAQQLGTPVVASTAGSIPQIAGAAALLSPALDAEALAANLYWIVSNDEMYAKLVRRGHANVARFSWTQTARQLHDTYDALADRTPGEPPMNRESPSRLDDRIAVVSGGVGAARFLAGLIDAVDDLDDVPTRRRDHRRRQHRRRLHIARPVDLAGSRHRDVHARRRHRPRARLGTRRRVVAGDGVARTVRVGATRRVVRGATLVQSRRP